MWNYNSQTSMLQYRKNIKKILYMKFPHCFGTVQVFRPVWLPFAKRSNL